MTQAFTRYKGHIPCRQPNVSWKIWTDMHSAWHVDDIRYSIFERLKPRDLARLAQTCKALSDFATDELWRTVESMSQFMCCLPPDFRHQPLRVEDIQRFDFYSNKVQNLVFESRSLQIAIRLPPPFDSKNFKRSKNPKKSKNPEEKQPQNRTEKSWEELWDEIAKLRPTSEFLPNLRRLRISNVDEKLLIPLIGISGSNLAQIYIKYIQNRQPESIVHKILDRLQYSPNLRYLFVRDGINGLIPLKLIQQSPLKHLRLDPRISGYVKRDSSFKELPLPNEVLQKSTLENLTLGLTREWYSPEIKTLSCKSLPALKKLWLDLTTFKPSRCNQPCTNAIPHSWTCAGNQHPPSQLGVADCGRRSPAVFFEGLDNPELSFLNIKFPAETTRTMFLAVVSAANSSCRLRNLVELGLTGGGWYNNGCKCMACWTPRVRSKIQPTALREALKMLLPMKQLQVLRLSAAPNFLDVLDLQLYKSITDGLPALEKLHLGHPEEYEGAHFLETVSLHHLAAFCSMLPNLVEVSIAACDGLTVEGAPIPDWACLGVKSIFILHSQAYHRVSREQLDSVLKIYFPNCGGFDSSGRHKLVSAHCI